MEINLLDNKTIYFTGCSYTWGAGLEMEYYHIQEGWDINKIAKENDMSVNRLENETYDAAEYRRKHRFGNLVAKHFNINHEILNMGNGNSNEQIYQLVERCTLSVPKFIIVQLTHFSRDGECRDIIQKDLSQIDIENLCHKQIYRFINLEKQRTEKGHYMPKLLFIAWHKENGVVLKKHFADRMIPIHIDGKDYNSFEDTAEDFNNHNIRDYNKMRLCDVILGIEDTHLSSIGHRIVADSIIKYLKNEYI